MAERGDSPVWALLNSIKSRETSGSRTSSQRSSTGEARRAALDGLAVALDAAFARGETSGEALYEACVMRGKRCKEADVFVSECVANRVLDLRNSEAGLESAAETARGCLAVATNAMRRAQKTAAALTAALDCIDA